MKLLIVNEYFPPAVVGGAELSTAEQAAALVEAGHEVTVVTLDYGRGGEPTHRGARVVRIPFPKRLSRRLPVKPIWFQNPLFYLYFASRLTRVAREMRPHLIHAQNSFVLLGASRAARALGIPLVATVRDTMHVCSVGAICLHEREMPPSRCPVSQYRVCFAEFQSKYSPGLSAFGHIKARVRHEVEILDTKLRQEALRRADRVITVSRSLAAILHASGVVPVEPLAVYNLVSRDAAPAPSPSNRVEYGIPAGAPLILYAGKQSFGKGTDVLLAAVRQLHRARSDVHVVLAGRTNPVIHVPSDPRIHTTGPLPHERVLALHQEADVVVLPSVWQEPFPRVLLEAMAAGRAVVATRVGGIPELVEEDVSGVLVARNDPVALSEALGQVLADPPLRARLGRAARQRVEEICAAEKTVGELLAVYREVLSGSN